MGIFYLHLPTFTIDIAAPFRRKGGLYAAEVGGNDHILVTKCC